MLIGGYYQVTFKDEKLDKMTEWFNQSNTIVQHKPSFEKEEADACYQYMLDDNYITEHKKTTELEAIICNYLNCKNCIMTTSGTNAIILALMSLDLNDGDEVIVPSYTFTSTANAVVLAGAAPVFVDIEPETLNIDVDEIRTAITSNTKAVFC